MNGQALLVRTAEHIMEMMTQGEAGSQAEVAVGSERTFTCEVRRGKIETLREAEEHWVCLRLIRDGRLGSAYATDLAEPSIVQAVQQVRDNRRYTAVDPCWELPSGPMIYSEGEYADGTYLDVRAEDKIERAFQAEREALAEDPRIRRMESAAYEDYYGQRFVMNNRGCAAGDEGTVFVVRVAVIAEDGQDQQSGYEFQAVRSIRDLDVRSVSKQAAGHAIGSLGARPLPTEKMPVLFTPTVMGQLIHALAPAFSGQQAQKGKSVLAGRLDTAVASSRFTLTDDGSLKGGLGSSRSDAEGVPTQKKVLVENGVLKGFLHNTYSANRDKTRSTGNAVRTSFKGLPDVGITNLIIRPGASSSEAIIGRLSRALQVENAMGMHTVDPISGDFSLSVDGHLIENGKRTHPVRQVTIAGNMIDLLGSIDAIGNDLIFKGSIGAPSVLVRAMMVSGK